MACQHDLNWDDDGYHEMPECDIHVDCDQKCKALANPETREELIAALEHWRRHRWLSGCAHGN